MDTTGYDMENGSAEESLDRRLKLENAATGVAFSVSRLHGSSSNEGSRQEGGKSSKGDSGSKTPRNK